MIAATSAAATLPHRLLPPNHHAQQLSHSNSMLSNSSLLQHDASTARRIQISKISSKDFLHQPFIRNASKLTLHQQLRHPCQQLPPDNFAGVTASQYLTASFRDARLIYTSLHQAVLDARPAQVHLLLQQDAARANARDVFGRTPLMLCAFLPPNSPAACHIVQLLLGVPGIRVAQRDHQMRTALVHFVMAGQFELVRVTLDTAEDPEGDLCDPDADGNNPLHHAAQHGCVRATALLVRYFQQSALELDQCNQLDYTPLLVACRHGNWRAAAVLVQTDQCSVEARDSEYFMNAAEWMRWFEADVTERDRQHREARRHHPRPTKSALMRPLYLQERLAQEQQPECFSMGMSFTARPPATTTSPRKTRVERDSRELSGGFARSDGVSRTQRMSGDCHQTDPNTLDRAKTANALLRNLYKSMSRRPDKPIDVLQQSVDLKSCDIPRLAKSARFQYDMKIARPEKVLNNFDQATTSETTMSENNEEINKNEPRSCDQIKIVKSNFDFEKLSENDVKHWLTKKLRQKSESNDTEPRKNILNERKSKNSLTRALNQRKKAPTRPSSKSVSKFQSIGRSNSAQIAHRLLGEANLSQR